MFTGIIEATAVITNIEKEAENVHFTLTCSFTEELKIDQSVAHNGCCLTVVEVSEKFYRVTAIAETLEKTNLSFWNIGDEVNVERCLKFDGRLDGHIVQGHVDQTGIVKNIEDKNGSFLITIRYDEINDFITVPQGSITVNGISLTVAESGSGEFSVAIIPYTWDFTNMKNLRIDDVVNLEFDIIGKYVTKLMKRNAIH